MQSAADFPATACDLTLFLKGLLEDGRALVTATPLAENSPLALSVLRELAQRAREELALEAPQFSSEAGLWAARLTYHLAQFTVCRDIGQEHIDLICNLPCPTGKTPEALWSVDLTLRQLPRLFRLAKRLSGGDPLVTNMERIAAEWPLSSVGIRAIKIVDASKINGHPTLARLYVDRIFAESDESRLGDPIIDNWLRRDLGMHRGLAPALAQRLFAKTNERN
jgi:hypothetical protein